MKNRNTDTQFFLGIDTSCYTTSAALVDQQGNLVADERILLPVKEGERGLRQGDAFFLHGKNLPIVLGRIADAMPNQTTLLSKLRAIAVSVRPRPGTDTYLPVFLAGGNIARSLSIISSLPLVETSHQEGHIMAGLMSTEASLLQENCFLAVHLSGGTTEILLVNKNIEYGHGSAPLFIERIMASSGDLHAGQLVDRVGVAMGMKFPAGPQLEKIAQSCGPLDESFSTSVKKVDGKLKISFSGVESQAYRAIAAGVNHSEIARKVEGAIAKGLEKALLPIIESAKVKKILVVGGVAANKYIRNRLVHRLEHPALGAKLFFAEPALSADNAFGVAHIGRYWWLTK